MSYSGPVYENQPPRRGPAYRSVEAAKVGVSFGSALAMVISWSVNHSIIWAIIHGILSWIYVIYYALLK